LIDVLEHLLCDQAVLGDYTTPGIGAVLCRSAQSLKAMASEMDIIHPRTYIHLHISSFPPVRCSLKCGKAYIFNVFRK